MKSLMIVFRRRPYTVEYLSDVAAMMNALLDGNVPKVVQLQGSTRMNSGLRSEIAQVRSPR